MPIYDLIEAHDIGLSFEELEDDHSGLLLVEDGEAEIVINSTHHPNRQRFTAAHELGHFVLHAQGKDRQFVDTAFNRDSASARGTKQEEIEANRFAAEVLMPRSLIVDALPQDPISDLDVFMLSMLFEVSEQAMDLRLVNLKLIEP